MSTAVPEAGVERSSGIVRVEESFLAPPGWNSFCDQFGYDGFHLRSEWADIFAGALLHQPRFLTARRGSSIVGILPLMLIDGPIFGRFLVSQPYLNSGGILSASDFVAGQLLDAAAALADELNVRHLELRHEKRVEHSALNGENLEKVHMRLALPGTADDLWNGLKSKVRSQIRKPLNDSRLTCEVGQTDQLSNFYDIFCVNMRDLGTPPFSRSLFAQMLDRFADRAEICTVRYDGRPVASGFLLHGPEVTLIPAASSLREFNHTSCNMLMYWHALQRSIELGQKAFDFGRSTPGCGTHRFKQQWGAEEFPAVWQYYSRQGKITDARPSGGKYDQMIRLWKKLPVWVTRLIGPTIVRGIP